MVRWENDSLDRFLILLTLAHIREQRRLSLGSYGRPRMTEELQELGLEVGHRRVGRLMAENGIKVVRTRKYKATTDSNHAFSVTPNLLGRDFAADAPNQKLAGDISVRRENSPPDCFLIRQTWTAEGWLYLAVILDLYSRRVIGWALCDRLKRDLAIKALDMAVALRQPPPGCIHHTDRGSQYCSGDYQKRLKKHGFRISMNGKGNCFDNAVVESFFKILKAELMWRRQWATRRQAEIALFEYINGFYNPRNGTQPQREEPAPLRAKGGMNEIGDRNFIRTGLLPKHSRWNPSLEPPRRGAHISCSESFILDIHTPRRQVLASHHT